MANPKLRPLNTIESKKESSTMNNQIKNNKIQSKSQVYHSRARYDDVTLRHRHTTLALPLLVGDPLGSPHQLVPRSDHLRSLHTKEHGQ